MIPPIEQEGFSETRKYSQKEIAKMFGKNRTTILRWWQRGLQCHRSKADNRGYTFGHELQAWFLAEY